LNYTRLVLRSTFAVILFFRRAKNSDSLFENRRNFKIYNVCLPQRETAINVARFL